MFLRFAPRRSPESLVKRFACGVSHSIFWFCFLLMVSDEVVNPQMTRMVTSSTWACVVRSSARVTILWINLNSRSKLLSIHFSNPTQLHHKTKVASQRTHTMTSYSSIIFAKLDRPPVLGLRHNPQFLLDYP
jgi:hypothetical protein